MPVAYTDIDRLILERWEDTKGLLGAYEDLQERIREVLCDIGTRVERWASSQGYKSVADAKNASFSIYRHTWEHSRREEALVYFALEDCAPIGYRRIKQPHPSLWLYTEDLAGMKMKEADRIRFAAEVRTRLGDLALGWHHEDASEADYPLGKSLADVSDADRVKFVSDPDELFTFVTNSLEQTFTLANAVDQALAAVRARE
jgi:hypothetical protein